MEHFIDGFGHSRGEEDVLPSRPHHLKNMGELWPEAKIEHFIEFIDDKFFDFLERNGVIDCQIHHPAWRADEDVASIIKKELLSIDILPPINTDDPRAEVLGEPIEDFGDLNDELAGRNEDKHRWIATFAVRPVFEDWK